MDKEAQDLLKDLKTAIDANKKPFYQDIVQSIVIAAIVAIPTVISVGNKFENRIIKIETKQDAALKDTRKRAVRIDYNFDLIEKKLPELNFIEIYEDDE